MVGGGIGGTAAAYYLRQEFGPAVKIDVFEPGDIGGRLATVKVGDYEYETGGAVIHPLNLHMKHFIEKLGKDQFNSKRFINRTVFLKLPPILNSLCHIYSFRYSST